MACVRAILCGGFVWCTAVSAAHAQPVSFENLGVLTNPAALGPTAAVPAGAVKWYRFTIPAVASPAYLDVSTSSTLSDVEVGMYDSLGNIVAFDDDDGPADEGSLSFGARCQSRPNGSGLSHDGRDGAWLGAGDYYLAVAQFNATFGATSWNVTTSGTLAGSITTSISLGTASGVVQPTATDLGTFGVGDSQTNALMLSPGQVKWFTFVVPAVARPAQYLDLVTSGLSSVNTSIALYDADGLRIGADDDDGPGLFSALSFGAICDTRPNAAPGLPDGLVFNGRDGASLAPGRYFAAVSGSFTNFTSCFGAATSHTRSGAVNFRITLNSAVQTIDTPPAAVDLGAISTANQGLLLNDAAITAGEVKWFRFTLEADATGNGATYLDIHTGGSVIPASIENADTFINLYSSTGVLLVSDDDDGDLSTSQLSFGDQTSRGPIGSGEERTGVDGPLPAGTYYLSVMVFNAGNQFPPCTFDVTSASDQPGTIDLSLLTNLPPASTCDTADFDNDGDTGTDLDIEAFFACLAGSCCPTCPESADFNGDGDTGTDLDIEAFFRVLSGLPC